MNEQPHVLYRMYDASGDLLYVGITFKVPTRLRSHRDSKSWWREVETIRLQHFDTRSELEAAERAAVFAEQPRYNIVFKSGPALVHVKTGPTPIQRFRLRADKWARLGKAAASQGKSRAQVVNELTDIYLRDRPLNGYERPARVELTPEEEAAAHRSVSPVEQQERAQ